MLIELAVHNFAIIRQLQVSFESGLNILSGETGAGKSILVGAVNLILGGRASQEMIRTGAGEATVEAVFSLSSRGLIKERLEEWGVEIADELVIRRGISRSGRNRVLVNDRIVTLQQLQQLAEGLISISGQHEHQLLLDPEIHLSLLDTYGNLEALCGEVARLHGEWLQTSEKLRRLKKLKQDQAAQLDFMRFQLQELSSAKLEPDEDVSLEQERNLLKHAATLIEAAQSAYQTLYAGRSAILAQLVTVEKNLDTLKQIDPAQQPLMEHLEQSRIHLEELSHSLQQYTHRISFDPQRLADVEDRLALLGRLSKKYGPAVSDMIRRRTELQEALARDEDAGQEEEALQEMLSSLHQAYIEKAVYLSENRREMATRLAKDVEQLLASLDMAKARFAVSFDRGDAGGSPSELPVTPTGIDRVELILSANPGEDLKPLAKVASGGELSRILLALKSILSRKGEAETLIFDEVDAGIGGRTAELVGRQLKRLADKHQVICITHLPQIACYGEHHFKVAKETVEDETRTSIGLLTSRDRMEELARMLGGISISDKTRAHAQELLQRAQKES